ncbi:MAG: enoyl-CoA hydratase-related protein [Desulfobacterales bacterium]
MNDRDLLYRVDGWTSWITINREAKRNSISSEVVELFFDYLDRAEQDSDVRAVCITGAGDKAFCSGADLGNMPTGSENNPARKYAGLIKRVARFPKPTVARINGHCLAGGTGFMLACDIVIAKEEALFGTPEVNVGLWPMMIGALIFRNAMKKKAMEMVLLGERISAREAEQMGMVTRVVPGERLDEEIARILAVLSEKSPSGMRLGKEAFYTMDGMDFSDGLDFLCEKLIEVSQTEDAKEGLTAFLEKRKPQFKGK